jgi:hypothetical protein
MAQDIGNASTFRSTTTHYVRASTPTIHARPSGHRTAADGITVPHGVNYGTLEAKMERAKWIISEMMDDLTDMRRQLALLSDKLYRTNLVLRNVNSTLLT